MGALRPGEHLAGTSYQVVRELGSGGMGVVYEIEHVRLKKRYVAKIIHDRIKEDETATRRMEREAQVLASITHPNVVQVHDVGTTEDGVSYFVMEKLEGADLRQAMRRPSMTRRQAIAIVADVLSALEHIHQRGIVHRDIKPENVFIAEEPQGLVTKVLDFGIVHIFDRDGHVSRSRITKTGGFVGTLYYAAPEHLQGTGTGPASDVYAAGLMLFELLAGRGPFDQDPGVGLSRCFKPAPLLHEVSDSAPPELAPLLARVLEREPDARPSAGALAAELRALATGIVDAPLPARSGPEPISRAEGAPASRVDGGTAPLARSASSHPIVTSGGVYATVDGRPGAPKKSRARLIVAIAAPLVLAAGAGGVMLAKGLKASGPATQVATSPAPIAASSGELVADAGVTEAPRIDGEPAVKAAGAGAGPSAGAGSSAGTGREVRPAAAAKPAAPSKRGSGKKDDSYVGF